MRTGTDRSRPGLFRRGVALLALALLAGFAVPAFQMPASAAPGDVDAGIVMVTPPPDGPLVVGRPFRFVVAHSYEPEGVEGWLVETTITYVVPDEFRVDRAAAEGNPDYYCEIDGQTVTCDWSAYWSTSNRVELVLTPLSLGDDMESVLSHFDGLPGTGPGPHPEPGLLHPGRRRDRRRPRRLDVRPETSSVGEPVFFTTFAYSAGAETGPVPEAIDASFLQEVPSGITIDDVAISRNGYDEWDNQLLPTGSCSVAGQTVTCSGMDLDSGGQYIVVEGTPTVAGTFTSTATASPNGISQTEVSPDPTTNVATGTTEVTGAEVPSAVSGLVTDAGSAPFAGVDVWAYLPTDGFVPPEGARTITGADGRFTFPDLAPGTYALRYGPPPASGYGPQWNGGATTRGGATPVVVDGSGAPIELDEQLTSQVGSITGTVRGPGGIPAAGVTVQAFLPGVFFFPGATAVTPSDGTYTLSGLGQASYEVVFRPSVGSPLRSEWFDGSTSRSGATPVAVSESTASVADADLVSSGSLSGTVTGPTGAPLGGVRVVLFGPTDTWAGSYEAVTASDGTYLLPALAPASYRVRFVPPSSSGLAAQWYGNTPDRGASPLVAVTGGGGATGIDATWAP